MSPSEHRTQQRDTTHLAVRPLATSRFEFAPRRMVAAVPLPLRVGFCCSIALSSEEALDSADCARPVDTNRPPRTGAAEEEDDVTATENDSDAISWVCSAQRGQGNR
jgi:hypothetical protein